MNCFHIEAVDLGELQSLTVGFYGDDSTKWRVGKIYVKLDESIAVFTCGRTLGKGEPDKRTEFGISRDENQVVDVPDTAFEPLPEPEEVLVPEPKPEPKPKLKLPKEEPKKQVPKEEPKKPVPKPPPAIPKQQPSQQKKRSKKAAHAEKPKIPPLKEPEPVPQGYHLLKFSWKSENDRNDFVKIVQKALSTIH